MTVTDLFKNSTDETTLVLSGISGTEQSPAPVVLNREHALGLYREDALLHSFVCSPVSLGELCAGWLFTEGYGSGSVEVEKDGRRAVARDIPATPALAEKRPVPYDADICVGAMLELFNRASDKYARSHGIHECVLKGDGWHILRTDIGRHNAIDKAVGAALLAGHDLKDAILFTSGRINTQTVEKAARCGMGCLMSKAVITCEALARAEELGLKVLFSVKQGGYITK